MEGGIKMIPIKNETPLRPKYFIGLKSGKKYYVTGIKKEFCKGEYCSHRHGCLTNHIVYTGHFEGTAKTEISICEFHYQIKKGE